MTALCQFEGCEDGESSYRHTPCADRPEFCGDRACHAFVAASPAAREATEECQHVCGIERRSHSYPFEEDHPFTPAPVPESTGAQETVTLHRWPYEGWSECRGHDGNGEADGKSLVHATFRREKP
jgi:hypothetical protein